jgi:hypothetical protein
MKDYIPYRPIKSTTEVDEESSMGEEKAMKYESAAIVFGNLKILAEVNTKPTSDCT